MKKHLKKSAAMRSALVLAVSVLFAGGAKEAAKEGPVEVSFGRYLPAETVNFSTRWLPNLTGRIAT